MNSRVDHLCCFCAPHIHPGILNTHSSVFFEKTNYLVTNPPRISFEYRDRHFLLPLGIPLRLKSSHMSTRTHAHTAQKIIWVGLWGDGKTGVEEERRVGRWFDCCKCYLFHVGGWREKIWRVSALLQRSTRQTHVMLDIVLSSRKINEIFLAEFILD